MIRVLHVLQMSQPNMSGYSVRSKYIIETQKKLGMHPIVITSPFQKDINEECIEIINDINYIRTKSIRKKKNRIISRLQYLRLFRFKKDIEKAVLKYKPDILHAHSSFFCGLPTIWVGEKYNIPTVYEVRGVWEDTAVANGTLKYNSILYKAIKYLEQKAIKKADSVVVISDTLKLELIKRGIKENKIKVIYNGVDTEKFKLKPKSPDLLEKYNLTGSTVLGYIGTVTKIEGLKYLIEAFKELSKKYVKTKLMIIGNGKELDNLKKLVFSWNLEDKVVFLNSVEHSDIALYYSLIDIFILPRINSRVTNLVTPLKPLEIMASGKPLIGSDVEGIKEIINSNRGLLFKAEDINSLIEACKKYLDNSEYTDNLSKNAKEWVEKERDWAKLIEDYYFIYNELTKIGA